MIRTDELEHLGGGAPSQVMARLLAAARRHLALDVAFIAETDGEVQIFRVIDGDPGAFGMAVGGTSRLEHTYCGWVLRGALPNRIPDTRKDPRAAPLTTMQPGVGSYIGVPIQLPDGRVLGVLACASSAPAPWLDDHDERILRTLADVLASELAAQHHVWEEHCRELFAARRALARPPSIVFQPIVRLDDRTLVGAEALARFGPNARNPAEVFRRAWRLGFGPEQERHAIRDAIAELPSFPDGTFVAVNISPRLPLVVDLERVLGDADVSRVVVELTEHSRMDDPQRVRRRLHNLRRRGLRLAIDDAGAGFAGLNRIIELEPDVIKLDADLVHGIPGDHFRSALVHGIVAFGERVGMSILAEGIETREELDTLADLGIEIGQGWLLGGPRSAGELRAAAP